MLFRGYRRTILNDKFILVFVWFVYLLDYYYKQDFDVRKLGVHFIMTFNYVLLIAVINYVLVPRYFYRQKHFLFFLFCFLGLFVTSFIEENVLEKIFFPTTSGNEPISFAATLMEIGDFILYIFLGVGSKIGWDSLERQKAYELIEKEKLESELKFLKLQISPHMLFNSLNNIYSLALHGSQRTPDMILKLSQIMRYLLYEASDHAVPLEKELKILRDYISLQEIALEKRGRVVYQQKGNADGYFIAPLILISFVENCFKHSMNSQIEDIEIFIYIEIVDGCFIFKTENNFSETKSDPLGVNGIGLQNVRRRLELLYPSNHSFATEIVSKKYKLGLTIQLV